jgi:hypothetical protein
VTVVVLTCPVMEKGAVKLITKNKRQVLKTILILTELFL